LTDVQACRIREMRLKGAGYRAIATATGLSRDSVRNYCKNNGINGFGEVAKLNLQEQMKQGNACLLCGMVIKQPLRGRRKKFCSEACRREWWKKHLDDIDKKETAIYKNICAKCGREFESYGNKKRKYCSQICYIKDRFYKEEQDGV
jgi:hypothetical protein